ncbi:MAG TPA: hypothetical protein VN625_00765 [Desulfuromonadaceae bacterium]|nr:hypothetical protein [Desulfuromonadaceae bacterium]
MSRKLRAENRKPVTPPALDPRRSTLDLPFALVFGLFLGVCIWKFGNPVILDQNITTPKTPSEWFFDPWPIHWANWILLPLVAIGLTLALIQWSTSKKRQSPRSVEVQWLWLLPLLWFGWQMVSAGQAPALKLVTETLWQFFGCIACYFLGIYIFGRRELLPWLLAGVIAAFAICLIRAIDQQIVEFPQNRQMLAAGEATGWTNVPSATLLQMKGTASSSPPMASISPIPPSSKNSKTAGSWARSSTPMRWPASYYCCCPPPW